MFPFIIIIFAFSCRLPVVVLMGAVTVPGVMWYYGQLIPKTVLHNAGQIPHGYDINVTIPANHTVIFTQ